MTTLIAVYNNDGCKGRAVENTRELANEWMETFTQQHHIETPRWEVPALAPVQLDLFETLGV